MVDEATMTKHRASKRNRLSHFKQEIWRLRRESLFLSFFSTVCV
ncbi:unnamed protein product [Toxocara canis]|uniref:Uncharacterized protein n=1 Tax=Toxocara canis TaxID=6265 RepID=A0A3P7F1N5_TOXCA|nr:unnamed protein product [Toxocara canis]